MTLTKISPGQPLTDIQKNGLQLVSLLTGGKRDVILAIDVTESVGFNDQGRIRLRQIITDSLKTGDSVYVVPFAQNLVFDDVISVENPLGTPIYFGQKNTENIDKVLAKIPFSSDPNRYGTDIQKAELTIYQGIAQINQNRVSKNQLIKPQSVVWITDAPLFTQPGINSQIWTETPADSPLRIATSPESQERQKWIETLPLKQRSLTIVTQSSKDYQLSVVDINPTIQEFCTPAPGGQETCLVNPYLLKRLWFPSLILLLLIAAGVWSLCKFARLQKKWKLRIRFEDNTEDEEKLCILPNKKKIGIGEDSPNSIDCPGGEIRGHLQRQGEKLYLVPTPEGNIQLNNKKVTSKTLITNSRFTLNCPDSRQRDYQINVKIEK
ncbi:VWA domain-containing protein [Dolichospermum circinale]|uniref:VWA domain-containing protein n=1 Tax=Dolichospermum circinale TaxID=109265 RepID=UPI0023300D7A|nr:VWA domain-containing protein [Dolichospermum circinale]MDB9454581.1 VWA domain-containing protein [Dolichospermum circinale CS-541/06]MDB9462263.1 VWA domain-containing protein [Dolichospermum circinale CS-541/04]MDB9547362.1 VWA domain-containing protein [Dolichospermum circinale CS-1031]